MIDLTPFCDVGNARYAINTPHLIDGKACATDGRVLVRCDPEHAKPFEPEEGKFPKVAPAMKGIGDVKKWGAANVKPCERCNSTGVIEERCGQCDGFGNWTCFTCDHEHTECLECDNTGKVTRECGCRIRDIGSSKAAAWYVYLVEALPGVQWQLDAKPKEPIFFRFDHGDGALMGVMLEDEVERLAREADDDG